MANAIGAVVMISKGFFLVFVQIWVRWTLPRLRIDQVMMTCLKYLVPISCFLFLGSVLWPLLLAATLGRTSLLVWPEAVSRPLGENFRPAAVMRAPRREAASTPATKRDALLVEAEPAAGDQP